MKKKQTVYTLVRITYRKVRPLKSLFGKEILELEKVLKVSSDYNKLFDISVGYTASGINNGNTNIPDKFRIDHYEVDVEEEEENKNLIIPRDYYTLLKLFQETIDKLGIHLHEYDGQITERNYIKLMIWLADQFDPTKQIIFYEINPIEWNMWCMIADIVNKSQEVYTAETINLVSNFYVKFTLK